MVRKKVEGDEDQRRAAAREARAAGEAPSARQVTTGASKQRTHEPEKAAHEERIAARHRGKQGEPHEPAPPPPERAAPLPSYGDGRGYTSAHEETLRALTEAQAEHGGDGVYLQDIARRSGREPEETRVLVHDLVAKFRVASELQGVEDPDLGQRYEVKPRGQ
ncbi:hypothetical protein OEIGOIKO_02749 [Streptomyces chrestomyceticus JCM 4735]|uniref:Uncharacterized protein n=1 Tax=Streptomyces chrestomyceticus JCM 4735 TaxID=1306181 RepID=A0A7U9KUG0_9ACTN|nr:hypothetical protein [Streptomyces chrestomyceticus]GCD35008.1 hypothetical protein OEIGOIKO_02749 [Streptomyces chrestomyceticus JCM 4735]